MPTYPTDHFAKAAEQEQGEPIPAIERTRETPNADRFAKFYENAIPETIENAVAKLDDGDRSTPATVVGTTLGTVTGVGATAACGYGVTASGAILVPHAAIGLVVGCGALGGAAGYEAGKSITGKVYDAFVDTPHDQLAPLVQEWIKLEHEDALRSLALRENKTTDQFLTDYEADPSSFTHLGWNVGQKIDRNTYEIQDLLYNAQTDEDVAEIKEKIEERIAEIENSLENESRNLESKIYDQSNSSEIVRLRNKYGGGTEQELNTDTDMDRTAEIQDWVKREYEFTISSARYEYDVSMTRHEFLEAFENDPSIAPDLVNSVQTDLNDTMSSFIHRGRETENGLSDEEITLVKEAIDAHVSELEQLATKGTEADINHLKVQDNVTAPASAPLP